MTEPTPEEMARRAAERLQGTGGSIHDLGEEFEALQNDARFCAELDQLVFCCETCDNWFEISEMSDELDWDCESCMGGEDD